MGAVTTKTVADLRRRPLQAAVLATVLFLATGAATLALSVLDGSQAPFDRAFSTANGAHLVVDFDGPVNDGQLAGTRSADVVTGSAGPWPVALGAFRTSGRVGVVDRQVLSGRPAADAIIDRVTLSAGRWWQAPGEIVLDQDTAAMLGAGVGASITLFPQPNRGSGGGGHVEPGPGGPVLVPPGKDPQAVPDGPSVTLAIVGVAASVSTPDVAAWLSPTDIDTLAAGSPVAHQMLYRVEPSATAADLVSAMAAITRDLPANVVSSSLTYLQTKAGVQETAQLYVPILLAFAAFALLAAAFTIVNIVSGVVLSSYREIGVMKAVGFTPAQVTGSLLGQILLPVTLGAAAGTIAGCLASQPTVESTTRSFGLPGAFSISVPVVMGVLVAGIGVALLAAIGPAIRAGRLSVVAAITRGTTPSGRRDGGRLRRLGFRLPVALPIRLGVAAGVAHPVRALMTLGALLVGVAAVTFALGLNLSLVRVMTQLDRNEASPVRVQLLDPSDQPEAVTAAIAGHPDVAHSVALGSTEVSVPGLGLIPFVGYDGDADWIGYEPIHGRWFSGAGEVVAPTAFFTETGLEVGDLIDLAAGSRSVSLRLVGEIFDNADESPDHVLLRGDWADLAVLDPDARPDRWEVLPATGTAAPGLADSLEAIAGVRIAAYTLEDSSTDEEFLLFLSVVAFMGIVLVAISLGGVFDTVLLETRQRTREMAVLKAVGLTPRQVVMMVVSSVLPAGLLAGLLGVPLGLVFQRAVLAYLGVTAAKTAIPESSFDVFGPLAFMGLALAGLAIAAVGAYLPAQRAARARIAPVLQAE